MPPLTRRKFIKLTAATAGAAALGGIGYGLYERTQVEVSRVDVRLERLPAAFDGLTVAHLSDIHFGPFLGAGFLSRCVEIVNSLQPDVIALTGDFTFGAKHYAEPCAEALAPLRSRVGTYAVLGNHDHYNSAGRVARALGGAGMTVLIDGRERLERRGEKLWLMGVDDPAIGRTADLPRLLRDVPQDEARVTLAHTPEYLDIFAAQGAHTDFMLSGHTHGGQVRIPFLGAPHVIGQRYIKGLYRRGPMQIYTTRGIGTVGPPVRLNCPPEIVLYTLRQGAPQS
jgi:uncharacterized protein